MIKIAHMAEVRKFAALISEDTTHVVYTRYSPLRWMISETGEECNNELAWALECSYRDSLKGEGDE